jgi:predicted small secreted protein
MEPLGFRCVTFCRQVRRLKMLQKITTVVVIGAALALAACNTVRGAAKDVNSVANCTQNTMNGGNC